MATVSRNVQLELRRSIVSLRLKDAEFDRLRSRAAESGVSVSAYVRSCVLEADHLRAQVKQVLAEMRAGTLRPEGGQLPSGPAFDPALSSSFRGHAPGAGSAWPRFLARAATFLFGPWLAWRTRT